MCISTASAPGAARHGTVSMAVPWVAIKRRQCPPSEQRHWRGLFAARYDHRRMQLPPALKTWQRINSTGFAGQALPSKVRQILGGIAPNLGSPVLAVKAA